VIGLSATEALRVTVLLHRDTESEESFHFMHDCVGAPAPCFQTNRPIQHAIETARQWFGKSIIRLQGAILQETHISSDSPIQITRVDIHGDLNVNAPTLQVSGSISGSGALFLNATQSLRLEASCHLLLNNISLHSKGELWMHPEATIRAAHRAVWLNVEGDNVTIEGSIFVSRTAEWYAEMNQRKFGNPAKSSEFGCASTSVRVLGESINLMSTALVNAPGCTVYIGGGFAGRDGVRRASTTIINKGARIVVDGYMSYDGGCIAVWADSRVFFQGHLTARGGITGGNGGFVEVTPLRVYDFIVCIVVTVIMSLCH